MSLWFERRRGTALGILASGNYLAGAIWPPVTAHFIGTDGWRATYAGIGIFAILAMVPLSLYLRGPAPRAAAGSVFAHRTSTPAALGVSPVFLQTLLVIAGVSCCVAMSMPQVHLVAYCSDLGYGPARGAQMLAVMLACGIVSRLAFGVICDRIGGRQKAKLAQALAHDPRLVLLDEPTNGLDPAARDEMLGLVQRIGRDFGIAVIVTSHLLGELERVSDNVVVIDGGRLLEARTTSEFLDVTGSLLVEVLGDDGQARMAGALTAAGVSVTARGAMLVVDGEGTGEVHDLIRDTATDLQLGLVRVQADHHRIEDVFAEPDLAKDAVGGEPGDRPQRRHPGGRQCHPRPRLPPLHR